MFANVLKAVLNVKDTVIEDAHLVKKDNGVNHLYFDVRPYSRLACCCPHCGRRCPRYDRGNSCNRRLWHALDCAGALIFLRGFTHRVVCPEHGVVTAAVPWAFYNSAFTKDFDFSVSWLAKHLSKSAIAEYMRVDWQTVGRCIKRTLDKLEPDVKRRLNGLVNIGVDETSYRKGHKYITVVVNHDLNEVVWVHDGHGKEIFSLFFQELTEAQRASIKTVSGDGARWIDDCVKEYVPHAIRCTDPFHVVSWSNEMLDTMRRMIWQKHRAEARRQEKAANAAASTDAAAADKCKEQCRASNALAKAVKGALYALGKDPKNLTAKQSDTLELIAAREPRLYRAYKYKEELRAILKLPSPEVAQRELKRWYFGATHSRLQPVIDLAKKVRRHEMGIFNAIKYGYNSARVEATNNKIKLVIRRSFGFRNIANLAAMVMLVCSSIKIPLPNRPKTKALQGG